jgi:cell division protein FtsQ
MTRRDDHAPPPIDPGDDVSEAVRRELSDAFDTRHSGDAAVIAAAGAGSERKIIVIAEDDLPDTVLLDNDRGRRIVIDDETVAPRATAPPPVDPRLRARRIAVGRAAGRRRLRTVGVAGAVVVAGLAVVAVLASPLFAVDTVEVEGAVYADRNVIDEVVADLTGQPVLLADLGDAERRLENIAWVKEARATRDFPDRVLLEILERRPLAHFRGADGRFRVIDIDAVVLDVIDGMPIDYLEITGSGPDLEPGANAGAAYRGAAQLANALPPSIRPRVTSMAVTGNGEITLVIDGRATGDQVPTPITVLFGRPDDYQDKLVALVNEVARRAPGEVSVIDVSTGSPIVTPAGPTPTPATVPTASPPVDATADPAAD